MKLLQLAALLQRQFLTLGLVTVTVVAGNSLLVPSSQAGTATTNFVCVQSSDGYPTTVARTKKGDVQIVAWKSEDMSEAGFTPQVRCQQVSARFQSLYRSGQLKYITAGIIMTAGKKVPVVCATKQISGTCNSQNLLYTLKPKTDPKEVIRRLSDIRNRASSNPLNESAQIKKPSIPTSTVSFDVDSLDEEN
jgi:Circadian oscillating protein COP23